MGSWSAMFQKGHTQSSREQYDFEQGKTYGLQIASSDSSLFTKLKNSIGSTSLGNYLIDAVTVQEVQFNFCKQQPE